MSKVIKIKIEQKDIDKGSPKWASMCPIARAARRHFKKRNVVAHQERLTIRGNVYEYLDDKGRKAARFIKNFDNDARRKYCRPTTLRLKLWDGKE